MALRISSQMPNSSNVFKLYMDKCVNADSGCKGTKNLSKREEKRLVSFLEREDFIQ